MTKALPLLRRWISMEAFEGIAGVDLVEGTEFATASVEPSMSVLLKAAKRRLLQMHFEAGVGHLGGNLSCLDSLLVLHHRILQKNDSFVLSKGHAAGALYVTLWTLGILSDRELTTFHQNNTLLAGHPIAGWSAQIPFATGSLGHGFPLSAGVALGKVLQKQDGRVYCLMSDGEWQEGSNWEALIFSVHHRLANLTVVVDQNRLQGFGSTREVASLESIEDRLRSFGVDVELAGGHDLLEIEAALLKTSGRPRIVLLQTVKGHGVSFMENQVGWHYLPMTEKQYRAALEEVERS